MDVDACEAEIPEREDGEPVDRRRDVDLSASNTLEERFELGAQSGHVRPAARRARINGSRRAGSG